MAALESILGLIHAKAADKMLAMLDNPDLTAAELAVITKFLKDNGISCEAEVSEKMKELKAKVGGNIVQFPFNANEAQG